MSAPQREQLEALLASFEAHYMAEISGGRGVFIDDLHASIELGITSATQAKERKLIDRVAYEDEVFGKSHRTLDDARRFVRVPLSPPGSKRIAVISLTGPIVSGRSRAPPSPCLPSAEAWPAPTRSSPRSASLPPIRRSPPWSSTSTPAAAPRSRAIPSGARSRAPASASPSSA